jgi:aspartyl-tRNA(Asn)/glutamyl-tRNA(Gln) amidotransferase subunit A
VARWRRTGAIVVAKTNQHELAAGGTNVVSACGPTRNPWDTSRMTGGSSGGSAAAVATGSVPLALGSDTGGSIRIPASFCGVSGLKPTTGRVGMGGAMPLATSLDTAGPIAATVEDVAVAFGVLAGQDLKLGGGDHDSLRGQRVGLLGGFFRGLADPEVLQAVDDVAEVLGEAGLDVERVEVKGIDDAADVWSILCWSEFADRYGTLLDEPESVLEETRRLLEYGRSVSPDQREGARLRAAEIRASFLEVLRGVEVLLAPTTPHAAPKAVAERVGVAGGFQVVHRGGPAWFTRPISLAGLPALSIPAGFSSEGLPLGVQLIGGPDEEWRLFSVGEAYQSATDHHRRVPTSGR